MGSDQKRAQNMKYKKASAVDGRLTIDHKLSEMRDHYRWALWFDRVWPRRNSNWEN